ncbi:MAG: ABC transporter ATP-binding protein [Planctomycetota bacterium]
MHRNESSIVSIRGLHKRYGRKLALSDVSLEIPRSCVFALLGENGAGKTTLIRMLTGFEKPDRGDVDVLGFHPIKQSDSLRQRIGYVSDKPALYDWMTVDEVGFFAASFYDEDFFPRFAAACLDFKLVGNAKIRSLSKGQYAKVALALSLAHDPDLLIMDEPTSGLDPLVRRQFLESMVDRAAGGRTVLLSSHHIDEVARVADFVGILHAGSLRTIVDMQDMKDRYKIITVRVDHADAAAPIPQTVIAGADSEVSPSEGEMLGQDIDGRETRYLVRDFGDEAIAGMRDAEGVQEIEVHPATLEDIFITVCGDPS